MSDVLLSFLRPQAVFDVIVERDRQIEQEGWSLEHDDMQKEGHLAMAGAAYALAGQEGIGSKAVELWPWRVIDWKPKDRRRNLVRAAALIIAEIERGDRQNG